MASGATIESCIAAAQAKGYAYAGLQYGGQCYAGEARPPTQVDKSACAMHCSADDTETCGGSWLNSVYSTQ